jgi:UPF0755 protein
VDDAQPPLAGTPVDAAAPTAKPVAPKKPARNAAPARQGAAQSTAAPPVVQQ